MFSNFCFLACLMLSMDELTRAKELIGGTINFPVIQDVAIIFQLYIPGLHFLLVANA